MIEATKNRDFSGVIGIYLTYRLNTKGTCHVSGLRQSIVRPATARAAGREWRGLEERHTWPANASPQSPHHRPESAKELRLFDLAYYVVSPDGDTTTLLALLAISYQLL